jgi:hypothetical protein
MILLTMVHLAQAQWHFLFISCKPVHLFFSRWFHDPNRTICGVSIKGKVVPIHAMRAYRGRKGIVLHIHNCGTRCRWVVSITSLPSYSWYWLKRWLGGSPEPVWAFWRTEKSLYPARIRTLDCPAYSLVATPTMLCWCQYLHFIVNALLPRSQRLKM